jgi:hypothetical protein
MTRNQCRRLHLLKPSITLGPASRNLGTSVAGSISLSPPSYWARPSVAGSISLSPPSHWARRRCGGHKACHKACHTAFRHCPRPKRRSNPVRGAQRSDSLATRIEGLRSEVDAARTRRCGPILVRAAPHIRRCSLGRGGPCGVVVRARARRLRAGLPPPPLHPTPLHYSHSLTHSLSNSLVIRDEWTRITNLAAMRAAREPSPLRAAARQRWPFLPHDSELDRGVTRIEG